MHRNCYGMDNNLKMTEDDLIDWRCDICYRYPEYWKTLLIVDENDEGEDDDEDIKRAFNTQSIQCIFCPRRGGALKQIQSQNEIEKELTSQNGGDIKIKTEITEKDTEKEKEKWCHVSCGQWMNPNIIRFNKKLNKFVQLKQIQDNDKDNRSQCYLCDSNNSSLG